MLVAEQIKLYGLWKNSSIVVFINHLVGEEQTLQIELVSNILPMESSEDDELNYVAYTSFFAVNEETGISPTITEGGFELRHVPIEALTVFRIDRNWHNADIIMGELVETVD